MAMAAPSCWINRRIPASPSRPAAHLRRDKLPADGVRTVELPCGLAVGSHVLLASPPLLLLSSMGSSSLLSNAGAVSNGVLFSTNADQEASKSTLLP
ncbi:hypothetical protein ZWY2020_058740 [Hordeum vulgare]|nr:hypothetical protein ZWY2020_058740 [Hordeum vulgare]